MREVTFRKVQSTKARSSIRCDRANGACSSDQPHLTCAWSGRSRRAEQPRAVEDPVEATPPYSVCTLCNVSAALSRSIHVLSAFVNPGAQYMHLWCVIFSITRSDSLVSLVADPSSTRSRQCWPAARRRARCRASSARPRGNRTDHSSAGRRGTKRAVSYPHRDSASARWRSRPS